MQKLKEQQARKGIDTEPHILVEIEDIEATLAQLQAELAELETKQGFTPQPQVLPAPVVSPPAPRSDTPDPKLTALRAQPRIFLCHASGDKPAVRDLYRRLRTDGFEPWLDEEDLLPGQDWQLEIPEAVRAADVVIVCLSRIAVTKAGYVQKEIRFALDVADEQPEGTIFLIPLKLEECEVPKRLRRWQWVNLFEERGYDRLVRALRLRAEAKAKEVDRLAAEQAEAERGAKKEAGHLAAEHTEADRKAKEEAEQLAAEKAEAERLAPKKAKADHLAVEKAEAARLAAATPRPTSIHYVEPERVSQKLLKLSRDPMWQMLGVLVAIIGVAWAIYTFYANGNILATLAPTQKPSTPGPSLPPAIQISPTAVGAGTIITVGGQGWQPNDNILLSLENPWDSQRPMTAVTSTMATDQGTFVVSVTFPSEAYWISLPQVVITAQSPATGQKASQQLSILPPGIMLRRKVDRRLPRVLNLCLVDRSLCAKVIAGLPPGQVVKAAPNATGPH